MCCGGRMCMLCTCLILVVILIGLLFGFGVFKHGFHKLKDAIHVSDHPYDGPPAPYYGRPFFRYEAAPPPYPF